MQRSAGLWLVCILYSTVAAAICRLWCKLLMASFSRAVYYVHFWSCLSRKDVEALEGADEIYQDKRNIKESADAGGLEQHTQIAGRTQ